MTEGVDSVEYRFAELFLDVFMFEAIDHETEVMNISTHSYVRNTHLAITLKRNDILLDVSGWKLTELQEEPYFESWIEVFNALNEYKQKFGLPSIHDEPGYFERITEKISSNVESDPGYYDERYWEYWGNAEGCKNWHGKKLPELLGA